MRQPRPSCKTSGKRWTYSAMVPNTEVFLKLFGLGEEKKAWKTKKIPLEDFEEITGQLTTSVFPSLVPVVRACRGGTLLM